MKKADEYRLRAKEALAIIPRCQPSTRRVLEQIAQAWLTLAHAAEVSSKASGLKRAVGREPTVH